MASRKSLFHLVYIYLIFVLSSYVFCNIIVNHDYLVGYYHNFFRDMLIADQFYEIMIKYSNTQTIYDIYVYKYLLYQFSLNPVEDIDTLTSENNRFMLDIYNVTLPDDIQMSFFQKYSFFIKNYLNDKLTNEPLHFTNVKNTIDFIINQEQQK